MAHALGALLAGIVFGLGLAVSQMINPAKVLAFLDIAGRWDPSLALVMAGALAVTALGYRLALKRPAPLLAERFELPTLREIDRRLLAGAVVFGIGWGLVGFCPGPAIASLALGVKESLIFVAAMLAGMALFRVSNRTTSLPAASSQATYH
jgi:uncharacterized membrane protein YedE/YeeE